MKRLNAYILKTFLPVFLMTFVICLFIVLMQFLWKYVEDMVGKGLEVSLVIELFMYAALQLISLALPLSILLASLMVFGSMGESLELLAIKSAGIPLLKMMQPLIIFIVCICIGAFFYNNKVFPRVQTEFFSLLLTVRQASPELDIPEGVFYQEIDGYSMYVGRRDHNTGMLYDVIIYDMSAGGFTNMRVVAADSARMSVTDDKTMLIFTLFSGQSFSNFEQQQGRSRRSANENVPFMRESFDTKTMMIQHDINLERMSAETLETGASSAYVAMDLRQLSHAIDSMRAVVDSINIMDRELMRTTVFLAHRNNFPVDQRDSIIIQADFSELVIPRSDTLFQSLDLHNQSSILRSAISRADNNRNEFLFRSIGNKTATQRLINRHWIEWHRKLVMPFTCLIFFFIGAPLGSIVRKGGLGMPIVISVLLFIVFYILNNVGEKMTRDGVWVHWFGMWFSSMVLLPLGAFLTYKAMNDSTIMNVDTYQAFFRKLFFIREKRQYPIKNVIIEHLDYNKVAQSLDTLSDEIKQYLLEYKHLSYKTFWTDGGYDKKLFDIKSKMEATLNQLSNSHQPSELCKAEEFPILINYVRPFKAGSGWARLCMNVFPIGFLFKLLSIPFETRIRKDLEKTAKLCVEMKSVIEMPSGSLFEPNTNIK